MPNMIAYVVLLAWPLAIYAMFRLMSVERALIWSILGGYMLLPEATAINLPMIPALSKVTLPNLTAFVLIMLMLGKRISLLPESLLGRGLIALFVLSPAITVLNNPEPISFATVWSGVLSIHDPGLEAGDGIPGLRPYDAIAFVGNQLFLMLPLFMARQFLASAAALHEVLKALVIAGLIYSIPMLYEVRFSPQLHTMIYGFFHHDFSQAMRAGGFRPFVFMPHGLWVAFFALMTVIAAVALARHGPPDERPRRILIALYLGVLLVLCKSLGAALMALALVPMVALLSTRAQLRVSAMVGALAMLYPLLRGAGLAPVWHLHSWVAARNPERAQSFGFRLENEERLLERAAEKPLFGWGSWGRNLIYDPMTGQTETIVDGLWILVIGSHGWLGYIATFGLLCLPFLLLWWWARKLPDAELSPWIGPLALILAANMIDLLPNATLVPFTWLLVGALLGHAELLRHRALELRARAQRGQVTRAGLLPAARPLPTYARGGPPSEKGAAGTGGTPRPGAAAPPSPRRQVL